MERLRDLMGLEYNWQYYDTQFRTDREYTKCYWSALGVDLQLTAQSQKQTSEKYNHFCNQRDNNWKNNHAVQPLTSHHLDIVTNITQGKTDALTPTVLTNTLVPPVIKNTQCLDLAKSSLINLSPA